MLSYPVLSENPEYPIITRPIWDTTITHFGGKIEQRRTNVTRDRRQFRFSYKSISTEDKDLLQNFFILAQGAHRRFSWVNPEDGLTYIVRFENKELDCQYVVNAFFAPSPSFRRWDVLGVRLLEVI